MGIWSNRVDKCKIKPGDHIYSYRAANTYSHHGIFAGGNQAIHFTPEINSTTARSACIFSSCSSGSPSFCPNIFHCGIRLPGSGVVLFCLDCFLGGGSVYRYGYGVSSLYFVSRVRAGTCTIAKSDSSNMVLHRAMYLLLTGFGKFDVCLNNCEDFALYCKTGLLTNIDAGTSGQVYSVSSAVGSCSISAMVFAFLTPGLGTVAAATVGMYHMSRYGSDIGVRSDVIKVEDEVLLPIKMKFRRTRV